MKKLLLSIALLSISAMNVQAGEAELALFNQLDTDQNGLISATEGEAHSGLTENFATLDIDADGQLTLAEFEVIAIK